MYHHISDREEPVQTKTDIDDDLIPNKIEDDGSYVVVGSSTDEDKKESKLSKRIIAVLIFCAIVYLWFTNFLLWLF